MTTMGLSSQVTVHMPSSAWKMITANVSALTRDRSTFDQRKAANSRTASPSNASTDAATCSPCMYSGMAAATSNEATAICAMPWRRLRAASTASNNTSNPSVAARWRWTCSRQALWFSNGRIALAT